MGCLIFSPVGTEEGLWHRESLKFTPNECYTCIHIVDLAEYQTRIHPSAFGVDSANYETITQSAATHPYKVATQMAPELSHQDSGMSQEVQ